MELHIRQANVADAAALAELGAKTFYDTFHTFQTEEDMSKYLSSTYTPEKVKTNLEKPDVFYYLGEYNNTAVGYAKLLLDVPVEQMKGDRVMEMEKIYVLQDYLGKGVGKKLMQQSIVAAVHEKFDWMCLGVWQHNTKAIDFYKQFGWEIFDTRKFQLGSKIEDDFLMRIKLK